MPHDERDEEYRDEQRASERRPENAALSAGPESRRDGEQPGREPEPEHVRDRGQAELEIVEHADMLPQDLRQLEPPGAKSQVHRRRIDNEVRAVEELPESVRDDGKSNRHEREDGIRASSPDDARAGSGAGEGQKEGQVEKHP